MKKQTNLLTLSAILIFAMATLNSCSKNKNDSGTDSGYYMKFKVDGKQVQYPIAGITVSDSLIAGFAYGGGASGAPFDGSQGLDLVFYSLTPIKAGDSFSGTDILGGALPAGSIAYLPSLTSSTYESITPQLNSKVSITITEITSEYAKGIFSGTVHDNDGSGTNSKAITNGEFYAKRQ